MMTHWFDWLQAEAKMTKSEIECREKEVRAALEALIPQASLSFCCMRLVAVGANTIDAVTD